MSTTTIGRVVFVVCVCVAMVACEREAPSADVSTTGSVIFIHPDGSSASHWAAARNLYHGPDGDLHWDKLPAVAVYRGHIGDRLTATSNAGATVHAYGIKVPANAYGLNAGRAMVDDQGRSLSVMHQAMAAGLPVGVVNSGTSTEPGTGCFLVSVPSRSQHEDIAQRLVESGADVILGGGEQWFVPESADGRHGPGKRTDGVDLIQRARELGFHVVLTRYELAALPADAAKVLGLFAANHTFNDKTEEALMEKMLPAYQRQAPTVAEMTQAALGVLSRKGKPFLLVVEEEGSDNFGNVNNAAGTLEALRRADEAIGVARRFVAEHPGTLLITAADSDAGGMKLIGLKSKDGQPPEKVPPRDVNGAPLDGQFGTGTTPFIAAPDRFGQSLPFAIAWATRHDCTGGVLVRAEGLNASHVHGSFDNTDIPRLIRRTLFGENSRSLTTSAPRSP